MKKIPHVGGTYLNKAMQKVSVCKMSRWLTFGVILVSILLIISSGLHNIWEWRSIQFFGTEKHPVRLTVQPVTERSPMQVTVQPVTERPLVRVTVQPVTDRPPVRVRVQPVPIMVAGLSGIKYESCTTIPQRPFGEKWPEEEYVNLPNITDILYLADPYKSRVMVQGNMKVSVGDSIHIRVELYDGYGRRRRTGGDLVRVWMKEQINEASATANVTDNNDGSYSASLTAFWEGNPRVMAAIISPREVIAIQFRRRYIYPPVHMNTANFERLEYLNRPATSVRGLVREETPCNFDPEVPGYPSVCNLTTANFGRPWYCGKPRSTELDCNNWVKVSERNLWILRQDQKILSKIEKQLLNVKYKAMVIPSNIFLKVQKTDKGEARYRVNENCFNIKKTLTWSPIRPAGYLYNRTWIGRHCSRSMNNTSLVACLQNSRVIMIGDSTSRQMFDGMRRRMRCSMVDEVNDKHHAKLCVNKTLNYELMFKLHRLPFCTTYTSKTEVKPLSAHLPEIIDSERKIILVLHMFAHFMNYHSHVFYKALQNMKESILHILKHRPNISIVIKGPHTFSFSKYEDRVMWMPDKYTEVYHTIIRDMFMDISDKVIYLDCQDITISSEQWFIHSEDYIVDALVDNVLNHVCPV